MSNFHESATREMIADAKNYMTYSAHTDIPQEIIDEFEKDELDILKYEFKKFLIHTIIEWNTNIFWVDGYDGSRKTSITTELSNPSTIYHSKIIKRKALDIPTEEEIKQPIMDLYREIFPGKGKTVFLDRSWNNRAFVQNIYWYCSQKQYAKFMKNLSKDLDRLVEEENYNVISFFYEITLKKQEDRLRKRSIDPNRDHRFTTTDSKALDKYDEVTAEIQKIKKEYKKSLVPFVRIDSTNKQVAMKEMLRYILHDQDYRKKSKKISFSWNPEVVKASAQDILEVETTANR